MARGYFKNEKTLIIPLREYFFHVNISVNR